MPSSAESEIKRLKSELKQLKLENKTLRESSVGTDADPKVRVPKPFAPSFRKAEKTVGDYFKSLRFFPSKGTIEINEERYVLVRASALSHEFLNTFMELYGDRGQNEALNIGKNILFDIAHVIGMEDAHNFHKKMKLTDPISKLSAGPVHFAYTGWAFVDILPESKPSPDENYYLKYHHPFSFEADSWMRANKRSRSPVCIMNAGYSSGWCEASFGMPLTSVEISCRAKGDKHCTFIMAPPHMIDKYLKTSKKKTEKQDIAIPAFLERKKIEEKLNASLTEKEVLIKEIHHRVKNNLQIISSLLNLQADGILDAASKEKFVESIGRIRSMAIIHELLYQSRDLSNIKVSDYFKELVRFISETYNVNKNIKVNLRILVKDELIDLDKAIPCGIIINELLSNAFKHAFPFAKSGKILIELSDRKQGQQHYQLKFQDDGIGMLGKINLKDPDTLGLQLINSLVEQLDGTMKVEVNKGTSFNINF
jgi:two-component sensor histidine kinase/predicted hydrocarbon binding protein